MNDAMAEVRKAKRAKSPFSERYIEFLNVGLDQETMDRTIYNIVSWQQSKGELRTNRQLPHPTNEKLPPQRFRDNAAVILANNSDAKVLRQLAEFREAHTMGMSTISGQWFEYITTGQIGSEIKESLDSAG